MTQPDPPTPPDPDPSRLEDWPVERLMEIYLARRRYWLQGLTPPPDVLGSLDFETLRYHLRARLTTRVFNKHIAAEDARLGGGRERTGFDRPGPLVMPVPKAW